MLFPQCTFFVTAAIRMFQMAGQVCWVTLGGIQPTGVPPPVLRPMRSVGTHTEAPAWPADKGKLELVFPHRGFGTHLRPAWAALPPGLCIEDGERCWGSTAVFRL